MQIQLHRAQPAETSELKEWIKDRHYLETAPPGFIHMLEFTAGKDRIGGMIVGRPAARAYNPLKVLQLHRMFFIDDTVPCVESQALAMMRKHVRIWLPQIRLLLTYSDPSVGHEGTVYEADGWCDLGTTKEDHWYGWDRHKGRARIQKVVMPKLRWVRTP